MPRSSGRRRLTTVTAVAVTGLLALAAPAWAHVTVHGPEARQGGYATITFQVPTEEDSPTTKLVVALPADHPIASVRVQPHAGWTYRVSTGKPSVPLTANGSKVTSVVKQITWTARPGDGIKPGEFDEFTISAGPLPKVDSLTFKALQFYAGGDVVRWIEQRSPGGPEPEHPAPVLALAPAAADSSQASAAPSVSASPAADGTQATSGGSNSPSGLAIVALVVAVLAVALASAALLRSRHNGA